MSPLKLSELNEYISCPICHGYFIDATTVNECLHTFCKSCIVKHIKNDNNDCPTCNTVIHERRPLDYITYDRNKQDIVYKLVPQLFILELYRRLAAQETQGIDALTKLVLDKQILHLTLIQKPTSHNNLLPSVPKEVITNPKPIYLLCPINIKVRQIRKLLLIKYNLDSHDKVTLLYNGDIVSDDDQISNLDQCMIFDLAYEISRITPKVVREGESDSKAIEISDVE